MIFHRNRRGVCAATIVLLMAASMTGCPDYNFITELFRLIGCASGMGCSTGEPSSILPDPVPAAATNADSGCQARAQMRELAAQQCSNQQDQWQVATTPGGLKDPLRCRFSGGDAAGAAGSSCSGDTSGGNQR